MFTLQQIVTSWNSFFFDPVPVHTVALVRIALSFVLLIESFYLLANARDYLGPDGLINYKRYYKRTYNKSLSLFLYLPPTMASVYGILGLHIIALSFVMLGLFTQVSLVIAYITLASVVNRNPTICNGGDNVSRIMLFLLIFSSCGNTLSLDEYFFHSKQIPDRSYLLQSPWAMRLMQIQLSIIYLYTAYWKMKGATYINGTAMYYVMGNFGYRRFQLPRKMLLAPFGYILTWSVLVIEVVLPLGLWVVDLRYYALLLGFLLHLAIEYLVNVHLFSFYMMACLFLFIDPFDIIRIIQNF